MTAVSIRMVIAVLRVNSIRMVIAVLRVKCWVTLSDWSVCRGW
jgi:hypothetical protein